MIRLGFIPILLLGAMACMSCADSLPNDVKFESTKWKAGNSRVRDQMVSDLFNNIGLPGKSRAEIIKILRQGEKNESGFISYQVSYGHALEKISVSRLYFIVEFDASGQTVARITFADA